MYIGTARFANGGLSGSRRFVDRRRSKLYQRGNVVYANVNLQDGDESG